MARAMPQAVHRFHRPRRSLSQVYAARIVDAWPNRPTRPRLLTLLTCHFGLIGRMKPDPGDGEDLPTYALRKLANALKGACRTPS